MKLLLRISAVGLLALLLPAPAAAAVDGEVELRYWASEGTLEAMGEEGSEDMPGAGLRVEIAVFKRLAFAGEYYKLSGEDLLEDFGVTQVQLDVKWRIISPTENTFFALGLGYESFELDIEGVDLESNSIRAVADGRFGFIGLLYVYGRLAYMPSLGDLEVEGQTFAEGGSGLDLDIGLGIEPIPILSLWVGYRTQSLDFENLAIIGGDFKLDSTGPYVGIGVHF